MSLPVAILAGGLGTRLGNISLRTPKSLIEVAGKPFVEHQLALLRHHSLTKIVLCIGHLAQVTEAALGDGSRLGMCLRYSYDGPTLLGTGGALRRALPFLGEAFFILYGDSYLECDYSQLETVYKDLVEKDQLAGFEVRARFYEIGSLAGLEETRLYLNKKLNREDL